MTRFLFVFLLVLGSQTLHASTEGCSKSKARAAEKVAATLRSWDVLLDAYRKYAACDDGAIAEGFTESVIRILVDRWDSIDRLARISARNQKFREFVLDHINESAYLPDLERVAENASKGCANEAASICADILKAASTSIKRGRAIHR